MLKRIFIEIAVILIIPIIAVVFSTSASGSTVAGKYYDSGVISIDINEEGVGDIDTVIEELKPFHHIEKINFGGYALSITEEAKIRGEFPTVEVINESYAAVNGERYPSDSESIDFTGKTVEDYEKTATELSYISTLKSVNFGDNEFTDGERQTVKAILPGVDLKVKVIREIYGMRVDESTDALDLSDVTLDDSFPKVLEQFPNLKTVNLKRQSFTLEEKKKLMEEYPSIGFEWVINLYGLDFDSLQNEIDLSGIKIDDLEELKEQLKMFPRIKKLDLSDCGRSNEELAELREEMPEVKIVWRLYLGQWSFKTDVVSFSVLIYNYNHKRLTSKDIEVLKYTTDLQCLDLGHQAITDLTPIAEYCPNLRLLILADNCISDLTPLSKLKHLHYLEFFVNQVKDLSPLEACTEMVDLNISYNYSINDITPLLHYPKLEKLWLEHIAVSQKDVDLLRETYPDAQIVFDGTGSVDQGWRWNDRYNAMIEMFKEKPYEMSPLFSKYDGEDTTPDNSEEKTT